MNVKEAVVTSFDFLIFMGILFMFIILTQLAVTGFEQTDQPDKIYIYDVDFYETMTVTEKETL